MDKTIIVLTATAYKTGEKVVMREESLAGKRAKLTPSRWRLRGTKGHTGDARARARGYVVKKTRKRPTSL